MRQSQPLTELHAAVSALQPDLWRAFSYALLAGLLVLAPTGYMFEVYDRVVNSRNHLTLAMLTLLVLFAFAVMEILEWVRSEILREAGVKLDHRLARRVFQASYASNLARSGEITTQPMDDLRNVREFLYSPVLGAVMEFPLALVFLVLIFLISPALGWAALVGAVVQVLLGWLNERSTRPPMAQANRSALAAQAYADTALRNAEVIESMGMLPDIHRRWKLRQGEGMDLQAVASLRGGAFQALTRFMQNTMSSLLLGLGAWLLLRHELSGGAGMMIVGSILGGRILSPVVLIVAQWRSVVQVREAWTRLDSLLIQFPVRPQTMPLPKPRGFLTVENLVASAPGGTSPILKGLAFAIQPGEALIVVGPSAAGKTTLARLLTGLWPASMGKVRLSGVDMHTWDKAELGPSIGYLPQGVALMDGTLAENIARFGVIQPALVEAAARAVGLHEMITALPKGYDTPVGRDGAMLSGGQRQRVALARALYADPVLVILDEPNSSLDEAGDAALTEAIQAFKSRGTSFVVMTHRTSVLAVADKMLVLRDGVQQAFGSRDDVLAALNKTPAPGPIRLQPARS